MSPIDILHLVTAAVAVLSGVLALYRMSIGPGLLDRTVATDVLTACGIGILAVMVVWWQRVDLGVLLVILALTAFMTAVVVTRYAVREDASSKRILTHEEAERQDRERAEAEIAAEQAELEEAARLARGGTAEDGSAGGDTGDEGDEGYTGPDERDEDEGDTRPDGGPDGSPDHEQPGAGEDRSSGPEERGEA
ncbi:monovalent cation/H+ antiporter complex subunit F [Actinomyces sp.]|uniref:monovalent cation/H+ antiporter complex subunit F n=1 Tax=Actinomyces sp. TaxID=29317 RepID=UPI00289EEABB|nr:monovalent cation/H+ antiporter complex subunit F [Actinomyces sp.]